MSLKEIKDKIESSPNKVKLIAVSKFQAIEKIEAVINLGQKVFGENRVQEATEKFSILKDNYKDIELHLIGGLQTNKVKEAVKVFNIIHTIDSIKLADAIKKEMDKQNRYLPCFIQVNTGNEEQKSGVSVDKLEELINHCRDKLKLNIEGLMCIPPIKETPDMHFALIQKLANKFNLKHTSMGMSSDFEAAIKYGSTHIRIGTAIFGDREV